MNSHEIIKSKIERLINIRLTTGVQPEDLANNIYLSDYKKISFYKDNDHIIGELVFEEEVNNKIVNTILRYIYSKNKVLLRIEEIMGNKIKIEWDREMIESTLINDIVDMLKGQFSEDESRRFINSLPYDLKIKVKNQYCSVA